MKRNPEIYKSAAFSLLNYWDVPPKVPALKGPYIRLFSFLRGVPLSSWLLEALISALKLGFALARIVA